MSGLIRLLLFSLVVLTCGTALSAAKGASGWFSPHCDGASFYLSKADGLSSDEKLNLTLHEEFTWRNYRPQEIWTDVYAERCPSKGKCQAASHARIWLSKTTPDDKRVSGKYEVDFGTQHLSGGFMVKYRKAKPMWICE